VTDPGGRPAFESWGDYFWDGQIDDCLRNKLGIHDPDQLENAERIITAARAAELAADPPPATFDLAHLREIHRRVFGDVFDWAGELRTVDIVKGDSVLVAPANLERTAGAVLEQLHDADLLRGWGKNEFVDGLTNTLSGLNIVHPFREGNGRSTRLLAEQLAEHAGYQLDWTKLTAERQNQVMPAAFGITPPKPCNVYCLTPKRPSLRRPPEFADPRPKQQSATTACQSWIGEPTTLNLKPPNCPDRSERAVSIDAVTSGWSSERR
jgi:cell filamentation protein